MKQYINYFLIQALFLGNFFLYTPPFEINLNYNPKKGSLEPVKVVNTQAAAEVYRLEAARLEDAANKLKEVERDAKNQAEKTYSNKLRLDQELYTNRASQLLAEANRFLAATEKNPQKAKAYAKAADTARNDAAVSEKIFKKELAQFIQTEGLHSTDAYKPTENPEKAFLELKKMTALRELPKKYQWVTTIIKQPIEATMPEIRLIHDTIQAIAPDGFYKNGDAGREQSKKGNALKTSFELEIKRLDAIRDKTPQKSLEHVILDRTIGQYEFLVQLLRYMEKDLTVRNRTDSIGGERITPPAALEERTEAEENLKTAYETLKKLQTEVDKREAQEKNTVEFSVFDRWGAHARIIAAQITAKLLSVIRPAEAKWYEEQINRATEALDAIKKDITKNIENGEAKPLKIDRATVANLHDLLKELRKKLTIDLNAAAAQLKGKAVEIAYDVNFEKNKITNSFIALYDTAAQLIKKLASLRLNSNETTELQADLKDFTDENPFKLDY